MQRITAPLDAARGLWARRPASNGPRAPLEEPQRALRRDTDAATVLLHPLHPALRHVVRVEVAPLRQRLREEQGHRRVVVKRRPLGRRREIAYSLGERFADRLDGAKVLRGHAELVADHEAEQGPARPRQQAGIDGVVREASRQNVSTTDPLCGPTRPAKPWRSAWGPM